MNQPTANYAFDFIYDGASATVVIDLRKGPGVFSLPSFTGALPPMFFSQNPISVDRAAVSDVPTTASVAGELLTVDIPAGTSAGLNYATVFLYYTF
jgi:hypothetical protein